MKNQDAKYLEYAELLSELYTAERKIRNSRRLVEELKAELSTCDGSYGLDLSAHAFKQISERLEALALEHPQIYKDVFIRDSRAECLLLPSNLKTFIITLIANAKKKGTYSEVPSKNSSGSEWKYTIEIKGWSSDKTLQLICIVENNNIKTGYFNFV